MTFDSTDMSSNSDIHRSGLGLHLALFGLCTLTIVFVIVPFALAASSQWSTKAELLSAVREGKLLNLPRDAGRDGGELIGAVSQILANEYHTPVDERCSGPAESIMYDAIFFLTIDKLEGNYSENVTNSVNALHDWCIDQHSNELYPFVSSFENLLGDYSNALSDYAERARTLKQWEAEDQQQQREEDQKLAAEQEAQENERQAQQQKEKKRLADEETLKNRLKAEKRAQELAKHVDDIKSGRAKVASFVDAVVFHGAQKSTDPIWRPMLKPDNKYYAFSGTLERDGESSSLLGKLPGRNLALELVWEYFLLILDDNTQYGSAALRLHDCVNVVGQYVGNTDYETVIGEQKTMAVFRTAYIEAGCE